MERALTTGKNLKSFMDVPGKWIDGAAQRRALDKVILALNSSVSQTYGRRERVGDKRRAQPVLFIAVLSTSAMGPRSGVSQSTIHVHIDPGRLNLAGQSLLPCTSRVERHVQDAGQVRGHLDPFLPDRAHMFSTEGTEEVPKFQDHVLTATWL